MMYRMAGNSLFIEIGRRITKLRERKGLTKTELAAHTGISRQHISAIEHGKAEPGVLALQAIASELDTSMAALLRGL